MKLSFVVRKVVIFFLIIFFQIVISKDVSADCDRPTCNYIGDPATATTTWQTVSGSVADGSTYNRYDFYLTSGRSYEFSLCTADGGAAGYDSFLCLYGYGYGCGYASFLAYNDDYCGTASKIIYTATQSGWTSLYISGYSTNFGTYTLSYRYTNPCADVDHGGADWTISSNTTVGGNHTNIGTFTINSGVTATLSCPYFYVTANNIVISGTINANGAGYNGGTGGDYGGLWAEGGYTDGRGITSCWDKDNCRSLGLGGGIRGNAGSGPGGGGLGGNGTMGYGSKQECGWFGDDGGMVGGGGGAGGGAGGTYGGSGGAGKIGGQGGSDDNQCGNAGCQTYSEGTGGAGGTAASTYGNTTSETIEYGSGGAGAGGGGRGSFCYSHVAPHTCYSPGGTGGAGGGAVKLIANQNLTINSTGNIFANGSNGSDGGEGGENDYTNDCCSDLNNDCTEQTFTAPGGGGSGAGGGSGGGIMLKADCALTMNGVLQAKGGNGGNGGNGGYSDWSTTYFGGKGSGGAGGGGGRIKIFINPCGNNSIAGSYSTSGGNGGAVASSGRAGTGSNGNAGGAGTYTLNNSSTATPLTGGSIGSNQSICSGGNPSLLTDISSPSIGNCSPTFTYQWMSCTSGCNTPPTNYTIIPGATGQTYDPPTGLTQTSYYCRRVTIGSCTAYSNYTSVTVVPDPSITISGGTTICSGGSVTLTSSTSGGTGTCSYQWQSSPDNSTWTSVATTADYTTPALTSTYYFRCIRSCSGSDCNPATSNTITINVVNDPAISISGSTTICSGGSATLTSGGSGGTGTCSYQWQSSPDQITWTNVSTAVDYTTPALTSTTHYRCIRHCSGTGCTDATSNTVTVTVVNDPSITISSSYTICNGGSVTLTSSTSGGTGTCSFQWQSSPDQITWTDVATIANYTTPALTSTTFYRCIRHCSGTGCSDATSNTVTVTVVNDPNIITQPTGGSICTGGSITLAVNASGGTPALTYQWYNSGGIISGATNSSYTANVPNSYHCVISAQGNGCNSITSFPVSVILADDPSITITGTANVCSGNSATLTSSVSGGAGTCAFQWQSSPDQNSWTNVANTANYNTPALASTTYYRCIRSCSGSGCNSATSNVFTVTVDTQPPSITGSIPSLNVEGCNSSAAPAAVTTVSALETLGLSISDTYTPDINMIVTSNDVAAGNCPTVITRTYTIADGCGNTNTAVHIIHVDDNTSPSISGSIPLSTTEGCDASAAPPAMTSVAALESAGLTIIDICSPDAALIVTSNSSSSGTCPIIVTHNYTVTDACGNSGTAIQTIFVDDITAPSITGTIPPTAVEGCSASAVPPAVSTVSELETLGLSISDACTPDASLMVTSNISSSGTCSIVTTRTYTVTDACGNSSTATAIFNISDNTLPVLNCPNNFTVNNDTGTCVSYVNVAVPIATDLCSTVTLLNNFTNTSDASAVYPVGVTTVQWTATDACGNSSICNMTVTVSDQEAPVLNCPSDTITCSGTFTMNPATATDNCSVDTLYNDAPAVFPLGTTEVTWTAIDIYGNTASCTQSVTISSMTATSTGTPQVSCYDASDGSITVTATGGTGSFSYSLNGDTAQASNEFTGLPAGTYVITVTDSVGCFASTTFTIDQKPEIIIDLISQTDANCLGRSDGSAEISASNGVSPYSYIWSNQEDSPRITGLDAGTYTVTVTDYDGCSRNFSVEIVPGTAEVPVKVNNVFSPNGDGINDKWVINNIELYPDNELIVINRWGNEVYSVKSYKNDWDGSKLAEGTYFFILKIDVCGRDDIYKDYVTIVR